MIKEALFSIIGDRLEGAVILDLFAGSGSVGLEALSRGARYAVFVEKDPLAADIIRHNIEVVGAGLSAKVANRDVFGYRKEMEFDIVFAGYPYKMNLGTSVLEYCLEEDIAESDTLVIVQSHCKEHVEYKGYRNTDTRRYGISALRFFVRDS